MISRNFIAKTLAFVVATLCVYTAYVYNQKQVFRVSGNIFGSSYNIISSTYINDQVHQRIKDELDRIDLIASNYKNNSELSKLLGNFFIMQNAHKSLDQIDSYLSRYRQREKLIKTAFQSGVLSRADLLEIDTANSSITVTADSFVGGSADAGVGYTTTSSY
mgnify:CR=1 FL=1